ncbi:hypothetical protein E5339_04385 [Phocaeicola sartorii]|uniref:Uncharacterized protein n=1 Tax=Phocaeicola sartorii TaxID=671267 RepID=A0A4S2FSC0_9BACT|nr:hypothetical protein E5339_04385 [Phocaeicola sartorii]
MFYLQISLKSVPLQCVFHSIRFKVNKGWSKALLLFLCLYFPEKRWGSRIYTHTACERSLIFPLPQNP